MKVTVCVVTFRRPAMLAGLLDLLRPQVDAAGAELVVVDNDPDGSAEAVCRIVVDQGLAIRYVQEPRPGIPVARNTALRAADDAAFVAFTDDDVRPEGGWLAALLSTQAANNADVVTGPVRYVFPDGRPPWASGAHCFAERTPEADDPSAWPLTSNVLIRVDALRRTGLTFDETYALAGGSDTELFRRLGRHGVRFAWASDAAVEELVVGERATIRWALRRSYRIGNTASLVDRRLSQRPRRTIGDAGRWMWWGAKALAAGVLRRDRAGLVRGASSLSRAAGIVSGALDRQYQEYARRG